MEKKNIIVLISAVLFLIVALFGCAHTLEVTNIGEFYRPSSERDSDKVINIGVSSYKGDSKQLWYFKAIIDRLEARADVGMLRTNVIPGKIKNNFKPDYTISIEHKTNFESSGWNWLICCPGWLIFTPAWHGYIYYAKIMTTVTIWNSGGKKLKTIEIDTPYSIRQAELDRTWYPVFAWSLISPIGATYCAFFYDSDITDDFNDEIRKNYIDYVSETILWELKNL